QSSEFADLKSREEEAKELERLKKDACPCQFKVTSRIVRALFEIALSRNWAQVSSILLDLCKEDMRDMSSAELRQLIRQNNMGTYISKCVDMFPMLKLEAQVAPIAQPRWIFVEDSENVELHHSEYFILNRKQLDENQYTY
ncbi:10375_t:CDS:2, partial [Funneliformis caledonium]